MEIDPDKPPDNVHISITCSLPFHADLRLQILASQTILGFKIPASNIISDLQIEAGIKALRDN